ncbi:MAG TPA: Ig-like domain-containing protein, partial [Longimicrobiales bacterium]|nr:Ig-like domain-containing protein [Longimicrobiales bacterium]
MGSSIISSVQIARRVIFALLWTITIAVLFACDTTEPAAPDRVAAVVVSPNDLELSGADSVQLSATVLASDGTPLSGRTISWISSDTLVVTVDARGVARARAAGTATIRAEAEGRIGEATIRVLVVAPLPVAAVQVTPTDQEFWIAGETAQFHALPLAPNGQPL